MAGRDQRAAGRQQPQDERLGEVLAAGHGLQVGGAERVLLAVRGHQPAQQRRERAVAGDEVQRLGVVGGEARDDGDIGAEVGEAAGHPISTVPDATMLPVGASAGSLQVVTGSPARAAAWPPIFTVAEPSFTVPWLAGGVWNDVPGGVATWLGEFVAVEPTVAAGPPPIFTVLTRLPSSWPLNGCGSGVGTGPPGDGTNTMWMSTPTTWLPCVAA